MALSLYEVTVPVWINGLTGLSGVLAKTEAHYASEGRDTVELMADRLAPDMLPFAVQISQSVSHSWGAYSRLTGQGDLFVRGFENFATARAAVADAIAKLKAARPQDLEGAETRQISWDPIGNGGFKFNGAGEYVLPFAMPNFWFHTVTAYAIARKNGAPIGKADFMARGEPSARA